MRKKYTTKHAKFYSNPFDEWDDESSGLDCLSRTVYECDPEPYNTGLLNASGEPIYASMQMDQIGFIRKDE